MRLVIVESPNKCSKVQEILGPEYQVMASVGHIRDLPEKNMGITGPNYTPVYELTKPDVVKRLKDAAARAEVVYLATDPDREGEAIAWHLAQALGLKNPQRVTYQSITKEALQAAFHTPRAIDMHVVQAQECRRVTDRLVGYQVSPILDAAFQGKTFLTAGRVQSVALRILVEREAQIKKFTSVTHYGVDFLFPGGPDGKPWRATWDTKPFLAPTEDYILDKGLAEVVANTVKNFRVATYEEKQSKEGPQPPFTTTTLQKAGEKALGLGVNDIMALAQKLFEGGHITYMRTDSPALSSEALAGIADACKRHGYPSAPKVRAWKAKEGAQEAHEAIRPTHFETLEAGDTEAEKALYQLIWRRAVATQVADAVYANQKIILAGAGNFDGKELLARASCRRLVSPGWRAVYNVTDDDSQEETNNLPVLQEGGELVATSGSLTTKKTAPPKRYTESGLVDVMERYGIGRPSTYGATVARLLTSGYVSSEKKCLIPTAQGVNVVLALTGRFSFMDFDFTKKFEELLDEIAQGKKTYLELTTALDARLQHELKAFTAAYIRADLICPECKKPLKRCYKPGKYDFFACNGCQTRYSSINGKPGDKLPAKKGA